MFNLSMFFARVQLLRQNEQGLVKLFRYILYHEILASQARFDLGGQEIIGQSRS
jgi:hypothetical protein